MAESCVTLLDLFCGCGGFSLGAELAGFHSIAAIDIDPILQSAYCKNFPNTNAIQGDVTSIQLPDWRKLIGKTRPDGIIGGPPCQGFSRMGKRQKDDPRNSLVHHFYRHVAELKPKFFVMENVEGLLDAENVDVLTNALEQVAQRYTILGPLVVNAANFGAPTRRRRVIVVGYDPGEVDRIAPGDLQGSPLSQLTTVSDAIIDLPAPIPETKENGGFGWAKYPLVPADRLSEYALALRHAAPEGLGWEDALKFHKAGFVSGMFSTKHSLAIAERYSGIVGGRCDPISKSYRLEWGGQCPTLRAGTGSEKGSFQAVRPLHPSEGRVISVREAARIQAFPDWFVFHPAKWHSFRMIGNSVSPAVSRGLLTAIMKFVAKTEPVRRKYNRRIA